MIITSTTPDHLRDAYYREEGKLHKMTKRELFALAKTMKLQPYAGLTKEQVKHLILKALGY